MSDSCHQPRPNNSGDSCCDVPKTRPDYLLWGSLLGVGWLYIQYAGFAEAAATFDWYHTLSHSVFELLNTMWWGLVLGVVMVAILSRIPREFVISLLGDDDGLKGVLRATAAGVLLDLCSHGILMVGSQLYQRGASLGQVMAFLIASPWNSFSLTLILIALIGFGWTMVFIVCSMLVAIVVGCLFNLCVARGVLPANPQRAALPEHFRFWEQARQGLARVHFNGTFFGTLLLDGVRESRMVLRWLFFGVLLASLIRTFVPEDTFGTYFGPTLAGLGLTMLAATIIEVCSEGSTPIAADLLTRANAPGNSFAFLMTGVSTDYTEIMVMKDTTRSWKSALFLPLLTVPQVLVVSWLINQFAIH